MNSITGSLASVSLGDSHDDRPPRVGEVRRVLILEKHQINLCQVMPCHEYVRSKEYLVDQSVRKICRDLISLGSVSSTNIHRRLKKLASALVCPYHNTDRDKRAIFESFKRRIYDWWDARHLSTNDESDSDWIEVAKDEPSLRGRSPPAHVELQQPRSSRGHRNASPHPIRRLTFSEYHVQPPTKPIQNLFEKLRYPVRDNKPGYIYWFSAPNDETHVKIGFTEVWDTLSATGDEKLATRISSYKSKCGFRPDPVFFRYMPCGAERIEKLIHATFFKKRRKVENCTCRKQHGEWFELSLRTAKKKIVFWEKFSKLRPWTTSGQLDSYWYDYTSTNWNIDEGWDFDTWFALRWEERLEAAEARKR